MHLRHRIAQRVRGGSELIQKRAPAILFVLGAFLFSIIVTITIMSWGYRPALRAPILSAPRGADLIPQPIEAPAGDPVAYVQSEDDYRFSYPSAWVVEEVQGLTRVNSPNGALVVSFGLGAPGSLARASDRLVSSIFDTEGNDDASSTRNLIGTTWERIDGSRSLIVSGMTADATGRSIRFLAITVRGTPRNYSISVLVPGRSNPSRVLPTVEAIVSSFQMLDPELEVVT